MEKASTPKRSRGVTVAAAVIMLGVLSALVVEARNLRAELSTPIAEGGGIVVPPPPPPDLETTAARAQTYSNIYRYDYVGPEACEGCHARNYQGWKSHPHSKMTRNATAATVVGDFGGTALEYGGGRVVFSKGLGELTMTVYRGDEFVRQYKVTRTIGSRFVQMYAGVESSGPEPHGDPVYSREVKLPFSFWIERNAWFPDTYDETPPHFEYEPNGQLTPAYAYFDAAKSSWKDNCARCHNTYPYAMRFDAAPNNRLVGFPAKDLSLRVDPHRDSKTGQVTQTLESWDLVSLGIACESCHFGGREHATESSRISFLPRGQDLDFPKATPELIAGARRSPYVVNSICNQCHSADTQGPTYPNGAASWNSGEARDMAAGSCTSKIMCTTCHDPHQAGPMSSGAPDDPKHVQACVGCHESFKTATAAAAHSNHSASVSCLDCHMPRIVHGLSGMIRTHRVSSPTDPRMLKEDWPNACNMCHLDRSLRWTLDALETRFGKKVDLGSGFVPSNEPLGARWLAHKDPVVHQVAAAAYARSPLGKAALTGVLTTLDDPSPPSRMFGVLAVEKILGRPLPVAEYTPWAPPAVRQRQIAEIAAKAH